MDQGGSTARDRFLARFAKGGASGISSNSGALKAEAENAVVELTRHDANLMCAHQVILDLASAAKEVVENALDAGASLIEVRFRDHGVTAIEVTDNGPGIEDTDFSSLACRGATSKIKAFEDLAKAAASSFGFRGEALASLAASSNLTITTCTRSSAPRGTRLEYDDKGNLSSQTKVAANIGTTVVVANLFRGMPVRASELKRNAAREFARAVAVLHQYAVISCSARIVCTHYTSAPKSDTSSRLVFATPVPRPASDTLQKTMLDNMRSIFGSSAMIDVSELKVEKEQTKVHGYISKSAASARANTERQFLYLNNRPVDIPRLAKCINSVFRDFYPGLSPVYAINIIVPMDSIDANLTPDKRTVFLKNEGKLIDFISNTLREFLKPESITLTSSNPSLQAKPTVELKQLKIDQFSEQTKAASDAEGGSEQQGFGVNRPFVVDSRVQRRLTAFSENYGYTPRNGEIQSMPMPSSPAKRPRVDDFPHDLSSNSGLQRNVFEEPVKMDKLPESDSMHVEERLLRTVTKNDFLQMEVLGQFNVAFIIVRLHTDLYIVDQHAADEKSTFEKLLATPRDIQQLIVPFDVAPLLSLEESEYLRSYLQDETNQMVLKKSGYLVDKNTLILRTVPLVKGIQFGPEDFVNIVHKLCKGYAHTQGTEFLTCDRMRGVQAYKACHSSVRFGMPLQKDHMKRIVQRLANMDHPWNCPHGRPTIRYLFDLNLLKKQPPPAQQIKRKPVFFAGSLFRNTRFCKNTERHESTTNA